MSLKAKLGILLGVVITIAAVFFSVLNYDRPIKIVVQPAMTFDDTWWYVIKDDKIKVYYGTRKNIAHSVFPEMDKIYKKGEALLTRSDIHGIWYSIERIKKQEPSTDSGSRDGVDVYVEIDGKIYAGPYLDKDFLEKHSVSDEDKNIMDLVYKAEDCSPIKF